MDNAWSQHRTTIVIINMNVWVAIATIKRITTGHSTTIISSVAENKNIAVYTRAYSYFLL